ncbi:hypothetical protein [Bartonella birtlesii]|uniref:Uncharacterized protein n=1 Tax=Bartonella birtlesii LL-WM9 TaxID=1094552 RepID=J0YRB4_9HYPH|nr:hypothetical protein [Bartonella birtlesii]EJF77308.1 hypothetical protein ME7_00542 [Bartonella birtlesii LL-WM9]
MVAPIIPMALVAGARFAPHIMRYLYPRVAPKAVTGAQRFGQFMKANPKSAIATGGAMTLAPLMAPEEVHAPNNPYLQNMQQPYGPFMPYTSPRTEMPLGVGNHSPMPNALESTPQELKPHVNEQTQPLAPASPTPPPEPTDAEKFLQSNTYKFFQSDAYQKLQDLFAGMAAAPSGGSGWDALASGVKHLNAGDKERRQVNQTVEYLKSKGYSEEEAAIMARNPQMLSALLTGDDTSKLPLGYQWYTNPQTGEREARPIKGSLQALEYNQKLQAQKEWEDKKRRNVLVNKQQLRAGLSDIADAIKLIKDGYSTGFVGWGSRGIGGTPAYELDKLLDGIRGGVLKTVFENLKSMSPNGTAGVGPISDFESKAMTSMFGSLDVGRDKKGLEKTLRLLETTLSAFNKLNDTKLYNALTGQPLETPKEISDQYSIDLSMPKGNYANAPIVKSAKDVENLPKGTVFLVRRANGNLVPVEK